AHDNRKCAALGKNVHTKTSDARNAVRKISGTGIDELLHDLAILSDQAQRDHFRLIWTETLHPFNWNRHELSVHFYLRSAPDRKVEIGDVLLETQHRFEDAVNFYVVHLQPSPSPQTHKVPYNLWVDPPHKVSGLYHAEICDHV